jgi:hypothetical protein
MFMMERKEGKISSDMKKKRESKKLKINHDTVSNGVNIG